MSVSASIIAKYSVENDDEVEGRLLEMEID
jgi:hypothetical protein